MMLSVDRYISSGMMNQKGFGRMQLCRVELGGTEVDHGRPQSE
jgi:hypothetical protein